MDLNLYLGLPPLPRPPGRLGAAMDCPAPAEAPRTGDEPASRSPAPPPSPAAYRPSDALSSPIDPILVDWLDGVGTDSEDTLEAGEPAEELDAPSDDGLSTTDSEDTLDAGEPELEFNLPSAHDVYMLLQEQDSVFPVPESPAADDEPAAGLPAQEDILPLLDLPMDDDFDWRASPSMGSEEALDAGALAAAFDDAPDSEEEMPPLPLAGLEGVRLEWVERLSRPDRARAAPAAGAEMVSTGRSAEGAIEDTVPELRLQRLIQVSEQHRIVRPGTANRSQRASSPEAERLAQAIQRSHSSLDVSRRQNLDGEGKMVAGMGASKKDGTCGCSSSFECNICLDAAKEPVVTPCGHLFCWPCLYQWLHGHSAHSECPVCKGEVLEVNVTPIYGRGGGGERDASSIDVPPRPSANRSESLRQQLQVPDPRGIASMVRRLIENQDHLRGQAAPPTAGVEVALLPEGGRVTSRIVRRRVSPSLVSPSPLTRLVRRPAPHIGNRVQLPSSNSDNAAPAVPQQSSSVEQASTSSTVAVIVGEAAQSRRSRLPSESAPTRRTRRRQQH